jgi:hypothetical protein
MTWSLLKCVATRLQQELSDDHKYISLEGKFNFKIILDTINYFVYL